MGRMSKQQIKLHKQAEELLKKDVLTQADKQFVFENWNEAYEFDVSATGAFFTPLDLAFDFAIDIGGKKILDLCAGIGSLSYAYHARQTYWEPDPELQITCVERNKRYVEVGMKLLPSATWICADAFEAHEFVGKDFDMVISNPPFGNVKTNHKGPRYTGNDFEYKLIDYASQFAKSGAFIIPQMSCNFRYSGQQYYKNDDSTRSSKYLKFYKETGIEFEAGCGVDCSIFTKDWKNTNILVEIATCEFN